MLVIGLILVTAIYPPYEILAPKHLPRICPEAASAEDYMCNSGLA